MAVRIPQSLSTSLQPETGWSVLGHELREQKAHTLGALSGQVEQALAALRAFDAEAHEPDTGIVAVPCWTGQPTSSGPS
ncbi:hypothetical protein [Microvirga aerophila]|uniref:hypothetical protein n=1 Tax=Microvirga aerophila TaxID=670291 RepID=UPI0013B3BB97|nr:hypothetical protein [Microvirga aerophila]